MEDEETYAMRQVRGGALINRCRTLPSHVGLYRGAMPQTLLQRLGAKAGQQIRRFGQLAHLAGTQEDKMRRIFPLGNGSLKDDCIRFGQQHMSERGLTSCPVFKPVLIITAPGAERQKPHLDQAEGKEGDDTYSMLTAVNNRLVHFKSEPSPVCMKPGETISWPAGGSRGMCHCGAGLGLQEVHSAALHMFAGCGIDPEELDTTWDCTDVEMSKDPVWGCVHGVYGVA